MIKGDENYEKKFLGYNFGIAYICGIGDFNLSLSKS